jgi:uncharacterized protein (TIGR02246 family)
MFPDALPILLLLALAPTTGQREGLEQELADFQQQLAKAWVAGDRAAIERIIAPDWMVTGVDGRVATRDDVLRDVFDARIHRILTLEIDDVRVRVFENSAVVTGRTRGRGEYERAPYDVTLRFTDVFVRRDGSWQAVASHASLVAP